MITADNISQFYGSDQWYRTYIQNVYLTEGVYYLTQNGCRWLIDAILSYQNDRRINRNPRLNEIQFWTLTVKDRSGELVCCEDKSKPPTIQQMIPYTDFPEELSPFKIYVETGHDGNAPHRIIMLPAER